MKGFTLIELLVVIAIIGILSAVVFGSLQKARYHESCDHGNQAACAALNPKGAGPLYQ